MKKFNFSLETYLKIKEIKENEKLRKFAEVAKEVNIINSKINSNRENIEQIKHTYSLERDKDTNLRNFMVTQNYILLLNNEIKNLEESKQKLNYELEKRRLELIQAKKEKEIIEILKEKKYNEFLKKYQKTNIFLQDEWVQNTREL